MSFRLVCFQTQRKPENTSARPLKEKPTYGWLALAWVSLKPVPNKIDVRPRHPGPTVDRQNPAPHGNHGKARSVGIYREIIIPWFLRWCRISSIHSAIVFSLAGSLNCRHGQVGPPSRARYNVPVFLRAWAQVVQDPRFQQFDWTVKLDMATRKGENAIERFWGLLFQWCLVRSCRLLGAWEDPADMFQNPGDRAQFVLALFRICSRELRQLWGPTPCHPWLTMFLVGCLFCDNCSEWLRSIWAPHP